MQLFNGLRLQRQLYTEFIMITVRAWSHRSSRTPVREILNNSKQWKRSHRQFANSSSEILRTGHLHRMTRVRCGHDISELRTEFANWIYPVTPQNFSSRTEFANWVRELSSRTEFTNCGVTEPLRWRCPYAVIVKFILKIVTMATKRILKIVAMATALHDCSRSISRRWYRLRRRWEWPYDGFVGAASENFKNFNPSDGASGRVG